MKEKRKAEDSNQNRSDPESVMSSLTSSTGDSRSGGSSNTARSGGSSNTAKNVSLSSGEEQGGRKRKLSSGEPVSNKKSKKESSGTSDSGSSFSGGEEQGSSMQSSGHKVSLFSDLTESNKEASSESGSEPQKDDNDDNESGAPSSTSASSSAAVVKGRDRNNSHTKHADVVIKGRSVERKHKKPSSPSEITSLEESFVLDYEEVFLKSNVPQIIASTAGRLVAWNDFFLKATGVTRSQAKNYTLFQLVPPDKLSSLFEIVAKALRKEAPISSSSGDSEKEKRSENKWDYTTMSLPCIQFPACKGREKEPNPLYITVCSYRGSYCELWLFVPFFLVLPFCPSNVLVAFHNLIR